jgi:hypothetical protein
MSHQLMSWLTDASEVLLLIASNLHLLKRVVRELSGLLFALGELVDAWRWLLSRCRHRSRTGRRKG